MKSLAALPSHVASRVTTDSECWIWLGSRSTKGYGRVSVSGRTQQAHRVVYEALVGPIPEGLQLDHLCRNRSCVNPAHLEPVTCSENIRRGVNLAAYRAAQTHCLRGHEFTPENTRLKPQGWRVCRTCHREDAKRRYDAARALPHPQEQGDE